MISLSKGYRGKVMTGKDGLADQVGSLFPEVLPCNAVGLHLLSGTKPIKLQVSMQNPAGRLISAFKNAKAEEPRASRFLRAFNLC